MGVTRSRESASNGMPTVIRVPWWLTVTGKVALLAAAISGLRFFRARLLQVPAVAWAVQLAARSSTSQRVAAAGLAGAAGCLALLRWWWRGRGKDADSEGGPLQVAQRAAQAASLRLQSAATLAAGITDNAGSLETEVKKTKQDLTRLLQQLGKLQAEHEALAAGLLRAQGGPAGDGPPAGSSNSRTLAIAAAD